MAESDEITEDKAPVDETQEGPKRGHVAFINSDIYQAATLNKLLRPGFRIEAVEIV